MNGSKFRAVLSRLTQLSMRRRLHRVADRMHLSEPSTGSSQSDAQNPQSEMSAQRPTTGRQQGIALKGTCEGGRPGTGPLAARSTQPNPTSDLTWGSS
jgi:hypothetical protein